jgi:hypothetical protein
MHGEIPEQCEGGRRSFNRGQDTEKRWSPVGGYTGRDNLAGLDERDTN